MKCEATPLEGVLIITPERRQDVRGFFAEFYNQRAMREAGVDLTFVQDNYSLSLAGGTLRGLHFQRPPMAQAKLIGVVSGAVFDVVVDLRAKSPTYGRHVAVELSAANGRQLLAPAGFAHGFCTLDADTRVFYKTTNFYSVAHDAGLAFDDPALKIDWPVSRETALLSDRDRALPRLAELAPAF